MCPGHKLDYYMDKFCSHNIWPNGPSLASEIWEEGFDVNDSQLAQLAQLYDKDVEDQFRFV